MTDLAVSDMMLRNAGVGGIQSAGVRICFNGLIALSLPFVEPCSVVLSRKMMKKDSKYCIFENSEEKQELLLPDTPFYKHFGHAVPHEAKCGRSCEYLYSVNGCASGYLHQHMSVDGN